MDKVIVYVDDAAYARQVLEPLAAPATAGTIHWVLVACAPRMTHRISKWVSHSARENWRAKWADKLFAAALPLLQAAHLVNIAVIDPPQHGPERSDPGGMLCQMLVRHGVKAEVSVLARSMPRISDVLNRHVRDMDADMLVMGAYGHSRFREAILGGATRNMLEMAEVPVLMAH